MVGDFERLAQEVVDPQAKLQFRVCGQLDLRGRPQLHCALSGNVQLLCQRCLRPVDVTVSSDRLLYLAGSEAEAERLEATLAEEDIEVLVVDGALDLAGLVEDEVLLTLPLVPMHGDCATPVA